MVHSRTNENVGAHEFMLPKSELMSCPYLCKEMRELERNRDADAIIPCSSARVVCSAKRCGKALALSKAYVIAVQASCDHLPEQFLLRLIVAKCTNHHQARHDRQSIGLLHRALTGHLLTG